MSKCRDALLAKEALMSHETGEIGIFSQQQFAQRPESTRSKPLTPPLLFLPRSILLSPARLVHDAAQSLVERSELCCCSTRTRMIEPLTSPRKTERPCSGNCQCDCTRQERSFEPRTAMATADAAADAVGSKPIACVDPYSKHSLRRGSIPKHIIQSIQRAIETRHWWRSDFFNAAVRLRCRRRVFQ